MTDPQTTMTRASGSRRDNGTPSRRRITAAWIAGSIALLTLAALIVAATYSS